MSDPISTLDALQHEIRRQASPAKARASAWFFKTGPGEYGEGDIFVGLTVPEMRTLAQRAAALPLRDVRMLLRSAIHEHRLIALEMLVMRFERASAPERETLVAFYLKHTACINNWDLVDASAPYILGEHLLNRPKTILKQLARSPSLWERRIAIVSTLAFIRNGDMTPTLAIATQLLTDEHDLIHKAVGWMLREVGKRDEPTLRTFLDRHAARMPRTMLRYAIERFPEKIRLHYRNIPRASSPSKEA